MKNQLSNVLNLMEEISVDTYGTKLSFNSEHEIFAIHKILVTLEPTTAVPTNDCVIFELWDLDKIDTIVLIDARWYILPGVWVTYTEDATYVLFDFITLFGHPMYYDTNHMQLDLHLYMDISTHVRAWVNSTTELPDVQYHHIYSSITLHKNSGYNMSVMIRPPKCIIVTYELEDSIHDVIDGMELEISEIHHLDGCVLFVFSVDEEYIIQISRDFENIYCLGE